MEESSDSANRPTADSRRQRLALAVQQEVIAGGRVESQSDFNAVIRFGKSVNHILHLVLSVVTLGLWLFIWLFVFIIASTSQKTIILNVDDYGNLLRQEVKT